AGRPARRGVLALGLPGQRARRAGRAGRGAPGAAARGGDRGRRPSRRPGRDRAGGRGRGAGLRAGPGARRRVGVGPGDRRARGGRARPRRRRAPLSPPPGPRARPRRGADPGRGARGAGDGRVLDRFRRHARRERPLPDRHVGVVGAGGGPRARARTAGGGRRVAADRPPHRALRHRRGRRRRWAGVRRGTGVVVPAPGCRPGLPDRDAAGAAPDRPRGGPGAAVAVLGRRGGAAVAPLGHRVVADHDRAPGGLGPGCRAARVGDRHPDHRPARGARAGAGRLGVPRGRRGGRRRRRRGRRPGRAGGRPAVEDRPRSTYGLPGGACGV
ncbi:MAG: Uncharacterized MFS-type transporter, partial [uncultured Actinomycetospora sp.]